MGSLAPHQAILHVRLEVHEVNKQGQCTGKIVPPSELSDYNLKPTIILSVEGFDRNDCLTKLRQLIEDINNG